MANIREKSRVVLCPTYLTPQVELISWEFRHGVW